jgi:hypothetical protein
MRPVQGGFEQKVNQLTESSSGRKHLFNSVDLRINQSNSLIGRTQGISPELGSNRAQLALAQVRVPVGGIKVTKNVTSVISRFGPAEKSARGQLKLQNHMLINQRLQAKFE